MNIRTFVTMQNEFTVNVPMESIVDRLGRLCKEKTELLEKHDLPGLVMMFKNEIQELKTRVTTLEEEHRETKDTLEVLCSVAVPVAIRH